MFNKKYLIKAFILGCSICFAILFSLTSGLKKASKANGVERSGAAVFAASCTSCHGANGSGNTRRGKRKGAKDLRKSRISAARGIRIITNGKGKMPSFKGSLSADEIKRVNIYVRGLRVK